MDNILKTQNQQQNLNNYHAGQRLANAGTLQSTRAPVIILQDEISNKTAYGEVHKNTLPAKLSRLELFKILERNSHMRGKRDRPIQLPPSVRTAIVLKALYPNGISDSIFKVSETFNKTVTAFICQCEQLY